MTAETEEKLIATVARVEQAVCGNGVPGLREDVKALQAWKESHPRVCPMVERKKNVLVVRGLEVAVFTAIIGGLDLLGRALKLFG